MLGLRSPQQRLQEVPVNMEEPITRERPTVIGLVKLLQADMGRLKSLCDIDVEHNGNDTEDDLCENEKESVD